LDTSAVAKLLVQEPESAALAASLGRSSQDWLVSSALLETELRRLAQRRDVDQALVTDVLSRVDLLAVTPALLREAGLLPGDRLRSLDAIHLATALAVDADMVVAYDTRLADGARGFGLAVAAPR
jgi:predicted nucleic acid-binding protein